MGFISKTLKAANVPTQSSDQLWILSGKNLKMLIGILGLALPWILHLPLKLRYGLDQPIESISHHYYTRTGTVFTSVMILIGIFLIVFVGYPDKDKKNGKYLDFIITTIAGIAAILVALFPTSKLSYIPVQDIIVTDIVATSWIHDLHIISAAVFLVALAVMCLTQFSQTNTNIKKRFYYFSGVVILICTATMGLGVKFDGFIPHFERDSWMFWLESIAVTAFGAAWLLKGSNWFTQSQPKEQNPKSDKN